MLLSYAIIGLVLSLFFSLAAYETAKQDAERNRKVIFIAISTLMVLFILFGVFVIETGMFL